MPCSICRENGHNKKTCPSRILNGKKEIITPNRNIKKINDIKLLDFNEAREKLNWIKKERKEQYDIAIECVDSLMNGKHVGIEAECKSGKRQILEAIHLMIIINHYSNIPDKRKKVPRSVFVTGLNRKDIKPQIEEQEKDYGILSVSTCHSRLLGEIINILNDKSNDGSIYIHIDECDYAAGNKQSLSKIYTADEIRIPKNKNRIKFITYSASPEELKFSGINKDDWQFHKFIPNKSWFGPQKYKDNGLIYKPSIFFDGNEITKHGEDIIKDVLKNCLSDKIDIKQRNVIVVRDTARKNLAKIRSKINSLSKKYNCDIHVFDQMTGFEWGDKKKWAELGRESILDDNMNHMYYKFKPVIIFISQICTRSTEICPLGHRKIYAWHDARFLKDKKAYNTLLQAIGRVNHYTQKGYPENTIKLYCDKDVINYTLGIKLDTDKLVLAQRIKSTNTSKSKTIFIGYEDKYNDIDVSSVPDPEWQQGDPRINRPETTFIEVDGKYCQIDGKLRCWGDKNHGGCGGNGGKQITLQYEHKDSERYMIRTALYKSNDNQNKDNTFTHITKKTSMYNSN